MQSIKEAFPEFEKPSVAVDAVILRVRDTDEKTDNKLKEPEKATIPSSNDDLRKIIEENKKNVLEEKKKEYLNKQQKPQEQPRQPIKPKIMDNMMLQPRNDRSRG